MGGDEDKLAEQVLAVIRDEITTNNAAAILAGSIIEDEAFDDIVEAIEDSVKIIYASFNRPVIAVWSNFYKRVNVITGFTDGSDFTDDDADDLRFAIETGAEVACKNRNGNRVVLGEPADEAAGQTDDRFCDYYVDNNVVLVKISRDEFVTAVAF